MWIKRTLAAKGCSLFLRKISFAPPEPHKHTEVYVGRWLLCAILLLARTMLSFDLFSAAFLGSCCLATRGPVTQQRRIGMK